MVDGDARLPPTRNTRAPIRRAPSRQAPGGARRRRWAAAGEVTAFNAALKPAWGRREYGRVGPTRDSTCRAGCCIPANYDPAKSYPMVVVGARRPVERAAATLAGDSASVLGPLSAPGLLRVPAEPARQLRRRRGVHAGQRQGLRLRRPARHPGRRRRGRESGAGRRQATRHHRLELRRLHDHVGGDADAALSRRRSPAPASPTGRATTARTASTSGCCRSSAPRSTTIRRSTRRVRRSTSSRT